VAVSFDRNSFKLSQPISKLLNAVSMTNVENAAHIYILSILTAYC